MSTRAAALILAWLLLAGDAARAQVTVGVLPIVLGGELGEASVEAFEAAILGQLEEEGLLLRRAQELASEAGVDLSSAQACRSDPCRARLFEEASVDALLEVDILANLNMYSLTLALTGPSGARLAELSESCDLCSRTEALESLARASTTLARQLPREVETRFSITPEGATITLDGRALTSSETTIPAGLHRATVAAEGFVTITRDLRAILGEVLEVVVELQYDLDPREALGRETAEEPVAATAGRPGALSIAGIVLSAAGALAIGVGAGMLSLDGDCANEVYDLRGHCELIYSTLGGSVAVLATGGAALIGGVILLVADLLRRRRAAPYSATPSSE